MGSIVMGGGRVVRVATDDLVTEAQSTSFPPRGIPSISSLGCGGLQIEEEMHIRMYGKEACESGKYTCMMQGRIYECKLCV